MFPKTCWMLGALLAASGVALGAWHAHGLEKFLLRRHANDAGDTNVAAGNVASSASESSTPPVSPNTAERVGRLMQNADVAIRYQIYHALGLLAIGSFARHRPSKVLVAAAVCLLAGVSLFSGGLYGIVLFGKAIHWAIVPFGGLLMIVGWLIVALAALLAPRSSPA